MKEDLTLVDLQNAERSLQEVARREKKPLEEVLDGIRETITEAMSNPDPQIQARWAESPFLDRVPTPEEFIAWCAKQVQEGKT